MQIVSLSPSLTEILVALGVHEELVGVTDSCEINATPHPSLSPKGGEGWGEGESFTRIGPSKALNTAKIDRLLPEMILADAYDNRPEEVGRLAKKWRTKLFEVKGLEGVCDTIRDLGRLLGKKEKADPLIQMIRDEMATSGKIFPKEMKKRTVILLWNGPYLTVNFDTYPSRLVEAAGGLNVFRSESLREFPVELEDVIEKDPEVLLLAGEPGPFQKRHIAEFRRYRILSRIPIHLVKGELLARYGMKTVEALKQLRKIYEAL